MDADRKLKVAVERFALGLTSADRQMRPRTAQEGGKAMAYAISVSLGAVEMPDDGPMERAWDQWSRNRADTGEAAAALAVLAQLIPEPIREAAEAPLLGQIALWLDVVDHDDAGRMIVPGSGTAEARTAEQVVTAAAEELKAARAALRQCLLAEADSAACQPWREAVAAAEAQLAAAADLMVANWL